MEVSFQGVSRADTGITEDSEQNKPGRACAQGDAQRALNYSPWRGPSEDLLAPSTRFHTTEQSPKLLPTLPACRERLTQTLYLRSVIRVVALELCQQVTFLQSLLLCARHLPAHCMRLNSFSPQKDSRRPGRLILTASK